MSCYNKELLRYHNVIVLQKPKTVEGMQNGEFVAEEYTGEGDSDVKAESFRVQKILYESENSSEVKPVVLIHVSFVKHHLWFSSGSGTLIMCYHSFIHVYRVCTKNMEATKATLKSVAKEKLHLKYLPPLSTTCLLQCNPAKFLDF